MAIVYILINDAMPGLVKIGFTSTSLEQRIRELDTTSVALPFKCYYAAEVANAAFVEGKLHVAFGDFRVRSSREFFRVDPFRVKAALEIAALSDATPRADVLTEPSDAEALEASAARAGRFRLSQADVPVGAMLTFARDENIKATKVDDTTIEFEGQHTSLNKAALIAIHRLGYNWRAIQAPMYWLYEGETLLERRDRLEQARGEQ